MKAKPPDLTDTALKTANESGFPFEIAVAREVGAYTTQHHWELVATEVPWVHPNGERGLVDLVARKGYVFLVVECKRRNAGSWVFLVPDDRKYEERGAIYVRSPRAGAQ